MIEKIKEQRSRRRADVDVNDVPQDVKVSRASNPNYEVDQERKTVEAAYLIPEVDNFVEAFEIKKIMLRIKLWLESGYPVHLVGPTGCGKSSLAMYVAKKMGRPVVWINGDESITTTDLVGGYSQVETETLRDKYVHNVFKSRDILKADWVDNPLTLACKYGYTLIYNEFSRTKPAANNVLLSVFEEGILELPTKFGEERYVKVHPEFKAILTSNPIEYAGVYRPQDALLDRLVGIYMGYYNFDVELQIVKTHTGASLEDATRIVSLVRSLREKLPDSQKPGTRACIMIAQGLRNLNGHDDINLEDLCTDVLGTKTSTPAEMDRMRKLVEESFSELS
jgi:nitric oxide reductase NorQ protein